MASAPRRPLIVRRKRRGRRRRALTHNSTLIAPRWRAASTALKPRRSGSAKHQALRHSALSLAASAHRAHAQAGGEISSLKLLARAAGQKSRVAGLNQINGPWRKIRRLAVTALAVTPDCVSSSTSEHSRAAHKGEAAMRGKWRGVGANHRPQRRGRDDRRWASAGTAGLRSVPIRQADRRQPN